jgi:hypothetical protein
MLPRTTEGMEHVCFFRHALALDEKRVKFLPEYAWEGSHYPPDAADGQNVKGVMTEESQDGTSLVQVKEVWFAGTHSDM